jgi:hypothetical protein
VGLPRLPANAAHAGGNFSKGAAMKVLSVVTITPESANQIKLELSTKTNGELALKYNTTESAVKGIRRGISWTK